MQKDPELSFLGWFLCLKACQTWKVFLTWGRSLSVLHHSYVSRCVGTKFSSWPRTAGLTFYCILTGLCLTLVTIWPQAWPGIVTLHPGSCQPDSYLCSCQPKQGSWLFCPHGACWLLPWHLSAGQWREAFLKWGHEPREKLWSWKRYIHFDKKMCRVPSLPILILWKALW